MFFAPHTIDNIVSPILTSVIFSLSASGCFFIDIISPTTSLSKKFLSGSIEITSSTSSPTSVRIDSNSIELSLISINFFSQFRDIFIYDKVTL